MAYNDPSRQLRELAPEDIVSVTLRGEDYRFRVVEVDVPTEKPEVFKSMYHVLVRGASRQYRLFTTGHHPCGTVSIEKNMAHSTQSPIWKSIGTVDRIRVVGSAESSSNG